MSSLINVDSGLLYDISMPLHPPTFALFASLANVCRQRPGGGGVRWHQNNGKSTGDKSPVP